MTTQTSLCQLDEQLLQELDNTLQAEFIRVLNTGNFQEILNRYGIAGTGCISARLELDTTRLKSDFVTFAITGTCTPPSTCGCQGKWLNTCTGIWEPCPCP
ncbi:MAG TPA: hypothetical protein VK203_12175 [Nostocaceae cyanobacterium]|nr:hypothetical protein [Nostocaceae cyanobacterium]